METQTNFELNRAIATWREGLASRPGPTSSDIVEMESHLRESHAALVQTGLSEEEAFIIACRRLGPPAEVADEFARAVPGQVWRERFFWIITVLLCLNLVEDLGYFIIQPAGRVLGHIFVVPGSISSPWFSLVINIMAWSVQIVPLLFFYMYVTRWSKRPGINLARLFPTRSRLMRFGLLAILLIRLPLWYYGQILHSDLAYSGLPIYALPGSLYLRLAINLGSYLFMPAFLLALLVWLLPALGFARRAA